MERNNSIQHRLSIDDAFWDILNRASEGAQYSILTPAFLSFIIAGLFSSNSEQDDEDYDSGGYSSIRNPTDAQAKAFLIGLIPSFLLIPVTATLGAAAGFLYGVGESTVTLFSQITHSRIEAPRNQRRSDRSCQII